MKPVASAIHSAAADSSSDPEKSAEEALARGDLREALASCARVHGPALGRLCMALTGSQAEADELVHEVLLLAYDSFPSYRGEGTLRSWLFGIARRVCARHLETRSRQTRLRLAHPEAVDHRRERALGGEEIIIARDEAERARRALHTLSEAERDAILLRYEADLDFREIALACDVDEATARKRVSRGLNHLREALSDDAPTSWAQKLRKPHGN
jgi:RNA polymerase sigma-70 factor, ECF subfamily